jgi:hypothetical protein
MKNEHEMVNMIMMWMVLLGILFCASLIGLTVTIVESIMSIL